MGKQGGVKIPTNEALLIPQVAAQLALGKACTEIAVILGIGYQTAKRIAGKEATKAIVNEIATGYKDIAKAYCMKAITEMNELSMEGLKKALKEGNVQAIRTHLQVVGLIGAEEASNKQQGAGTIQVILPGAHAEKPAIEVNDEFSEQVDVQPGYENGDDHAER